MTGRRLVQKNFDTGALKFFLVKFVLKSHVLRLDSKSGSAFLTRLSKHDFYNGIKTNLLSVNGND